VNHTTLVSLAALVAATLVIATFAVAVPAFADSSKTVVKQSNRQKIHQSGVFNVADQQGTNDICILSGANCGRVQGQEGRTPPTPGEVGCPEGTVFDVTLEGQLPPTGTAVLQEGDELCLQKQGANDATVIRNGQQLSGTTSVEVTPTGPDNECDATKQQVRAFLSSGEFPSQGNLGPRFVCVNLQGG
jgi:hypothetical protein